MSNALDVSYGIEEAESCITATKFMFCVQLQDHFGFSCIQLMSFA